MSPQNEITKRRPSHYSEWHRYPNLPKWCFLVDGDWFEMRVRDGQLVPVACFETLEVSGLFIYNSQREYPLWQAKIALYLHIKQKMGIPVFIVRHTPDCKLFSVARLTDSGGETEAKIMEEDEYKDLLVGL
ncbi:unnamed protein product [marine sediment metagenome]|uniref:Uncharacterized protein n=1 Tax=marine sediment metagenome TaxID=412755 RepID=X1NUZ9_9ZZZZ